MTRYTKKQIKFLRDGYQGMRVPELAAAFNEHFGTKKTKGQIKAALSTHKITCGRPCGNPKGTYLIYTQDQAQFVREKYRELPRPDLTVAFNARFYTDKTEEQLKSFTSRHRIHSGRTGRFEKGNLPWNTGTKGLTRANVTSFKKGHIPANLKPLGTERICSKNGHYLIKVPEQNPYTGAPGRYRQKHVVLWEKQYGKVPPGMVVAFKDGNNKHCLPENLMLISRAELLRLNQHHYKETPEELKPSVLAVAKLEARVKKKEFFIKMKKRMKQYIAESLVRGIKKGMATVSKDGTVTKDGITFRRELSKDAMIRMTRCGARLDAETGMYVAKEKEK